MIEELFLIEKDAYKKSPFHDLDARIKIVLCFSALIAVVSLPYSPLVFRAGLIFIIFFGILWASSRLSPVVYLKRLLLVLPFGGFIIFFQIFFQNRYYTVFHPLLSLPFGISIYQESIEFALILLVKFIVSVSFIILLSSTTKMQDFLEGAGRLGMPAEFTLSLGMMIRYLFVFGYVLRKMQQAMESRCFDPFNKELPYKYRLKKIGYAIGTLFIRSYEQGERTYISMLCRGYGRKSHLFIRKKAILRYEWGVLIAGMTFIILIPLFFLQMY